MTVEMTLDEAQILIACLVFAEGAALRESPAIVEALRVLRPWRSALLSAYLRERVLHDVDGGSRPASETERASKT